jgi:glycosyltransferase involved in cell wall biosynthesis
MRVFVVEPRGSGGLIHYAYQLCTALAEKGAEVTLVTSEQYELESFPHNFAVERRMRLWQVDVPKPAPPDSALLRLLGKLRWNVRRLFRGLRLVREWQRLTRFLIGQRPDVVQFGKVTFPFEAFFCARLRRAGLLLGDICHEFELREQESFLTHYANRLYASAFNQFDAIFLHENDNRDRFLALYEYPPERAHPIVHGNEGIFYAFAQEGIDLRARYALPEGVPVVLFFGYLAPSKGLPELLRAFGLVHQQSPARLVVAGYPSKFIDLNELFALADEVGISEATTFDARYIPIEEVKALMELATLVVYPYRSSTQSGSLQVAYTFGRPVVATRVGGLPEVVDDGQSGLLVEQGDVEGLARAILTIVGDPTLAARMGDHARHLSETRYAWTSVAGQILEVYEGLLKGR